MNGLAASSQTIHTDLVFKRIRQEESRVGGLSTAKNAFIFTLVYCQSVAAMCETTYIMHYHCRKISAHVYVSLVVPWVSLAAPGSNYLYFLSGIMFLVKYAWEMFSLVHFRTEIDTSLSVLVVSARLLSSPAF
jgi:hypothetical protein